jgi:signal transduction histidine kinase
MRSLRVRLLIAITLVAAIALIAVGLFSTQRTQLEFQRLLRPALAAVPADEVSAVQRSYEQHRSWLHVESVLRRAHAQLVLFSMQGRFIAASDPAVREATLVNGSEPTLRVSVARSGPLSQEEQLVLRNPPGAVVRSRSGMAIALLYATPLAEVRSQSPAVILTHQLWLAILCALLAAFGAAWLLAGQILSPVAALSEATAAVQSGDLSHRVTVEGPQEIAELARRFNDLSEHLERSEALRKRMISDIAHELRSPLTNIRGIVEALEDGHLAVSASALRSLGEEAAFLTHLVDDLQDLSLADAGQLKFDLSKVSIDACVRGAADALSSAARDKDVDISIRSNGSVYARADAMRVRQVINNLLTNAIRLAPRDSQIEVSVDADRDWVRVQIRDEGPGIKNQELDAVFERFYRADESRSRADGGAGLGLAIVKQLVEAHGGSVQAVNNAEGGATFSFTLPRR